MKKIIFLIFICFLNISYSKNNISFYFDNKYTSYKDKFINELAIKYNLKQDNFGFTTIGRFFDRKGDRINILLYYDNDFNRFEIGNYNDISYYLQNGITNITKNSFENDCIFYTKNLNNLVSRPTLLSNQNLGYINNISNFNKTKYNPKINYIINLNNISFGFTFINKYNYYKKYKENIYNMYKYGFSYYNRVGELDFDFSFLGESNFKQDFNSQDIGLNFNYYGLLFGGNYGFGKNLDKKQFEYYTYGVGYEISSLTLSLWYFEGRFDFQNSINININYKINKYINIYSEFFTFKINSKKENTINFGVLIKNL